MCYRTGKILFIEVRNKFCLICNKAKFFSKEPNPYVCYKNWSRTSTSMEADMIVEGFTQSLNMHGLIYDKLIGDGNSSVMNKLHVAKPHGSEFHIKKIECSNHILRNYCNRLREISDISIRPQNHLSFIIPGYHRSKLKENILILRYYLSVTCEFIILHIMNN